VNLFGLVYYKGLLGKAHFKFYFVTLWIGVVPVLQQLCCDG